MQQNLIDITPPKSLDSELEWLLLLDNTRIEGLLTFIYHHIEQPEWGWLYSEGPFKAVKEKGPLWLKVKPADEVWQQWQQDLLWLSSGIAIGHKAEDTVALLSHLKSLITVHGSDGIDRFLRFHSPRCMALLCQHFSEDEKQSFTGPAAQWLWYYPQEQDKRWTPTLWDLDIPQNYTPTPGPWFGINPAITQAL